MDPNEQSRLTSLHALSLVDTPPEERFDRISRLAQRTFGVPIVLITLIDDKRVWFKSHVGLTEAEVPRDGSFCEETLACEGLMIVTDATQDPRFSAHPLVVGGPKVRFYAGQPLYGPDGKTVGTLSLLDVVPRDLDNEQRRALRDLTGMVQEQLSASAPAESPSHEHTRLLARLRLTPEHTSARRRIRAAFLAIAAVLFLATGYAMNLAHRLVDDGARIETALAAAGKPAALDAVKAPLERLRATARFFSISVGVRGLMGLTLLIVALIIFDRHMDGRLSAMAAIELDRTRLQAVIDAIGDGVVVADANGRFTVFNPAAERILGLGTVDDPDRSNRFYLSFFDAEGAPCDPAKHPLTRAIAGETVRGERLTVRNERRPGGVQVGVTATPVRAFDGTPAGGVIIIRDLA